MDLHLISYEHPYHFPVFWSIFKTYWEGVNKESLDGLKTVQAPDGSFRALSLVEDKVMHLMNLGWKTKFVYDCKMIKIAGFLQYEWYSNGVLFVHSAYVMPEYREKGVGGFIMRSFGKGTPIMFHIHKETPPLELFSCVTKMARVCDAPTNVDLELWQGELV